MKEYFRKDLAFGLVCAVAVVVFVGCNVVPGTGDGDDGGGGGDTGGDEPVVAKTYVGSEACSTCHSEIFGWFRNSGHPYKINEVVDGQMPTYPFSSIDGALAMVDDDDAPLADESATPDPNIGGTDNSLGTPMSYDDVSFVIGGFGWKARFMDLDGYIVSGSSVQYNLETEGMVSYHNNETDKRFDCGNCHTTGWKRYTSEVGDDRNLNRQNDLPGIEGTFAAAGIQCEACHGAGSEHAAAPTSDNITKLATPRTTEDFLADDMAYGKAAACSDCHTRHAEKDYPTYVGGSGLILASGGLIRHHEQSDEMQGINPDDEAAGPTGPHANLSCMSCHDPHTTTRYMAESGDPPGMNTACTNCHSTDTYTITSGGMTGLSCTDCHMPLLVKSAVSHDAVGSGPATGDIKSHIFRIDLSAEAQMTDDGSFAYPWVTGAFACKSCHNGETSFELTFPSTMKIH
jgi:Cytochrome c554 and c-prime